jgi:RNA polymerase sigma factor (sigma-70 family)
MSSSTAVVLREAIRSAAQAGRCAVSDGELLRRFAQEQDQAAFAALVRRHTALVLGVCRRALGNAQDAEDACQAAFFVLARKARAEKWGQSVANWLYTTARRVAANARLAAQRRAKREGRAAVPEAVLPMDQLTGRELLAVLDEELDKLPPHYREPLVLCYLEGLTRDEAAARLGVPAATVKTHLERGRKKLGDALTKRGCGLGAGLLALAATSPAGASPPRLVQAVLASVSGSPPDAVAALAKGVSVNALGHKLKLAVLAVLMTAALGIGLGGLKRPAAGRSAPPARKEAAGPAAKAKGTKPVAEKHPTVAGRVLRPDGKPLAGAEILLVGHGKAPEKVGVTGADGCFKVKAPRGQRWAVLMARATGVGVDFIDLGQLPAGEVVLRAIKDHSIRGRVVDTEGKPVKEVTVSVRHVGGYKGESADSFLTAWKKRHPQSGLPTGVKHVWDERAFRTTTTGKDGKFTVTGTGAERVVSLRFEGAGIAATELWVVNRPGFDPRPYNRITADKMKMAFGLGMKWLLAGPDLSVVAEAEKRIRGVVKDRDTGKPRAGVKVTLSRDGRDLLMIAVSATTDARGRYEIRGARKAKNYMVEVPGDPATGYMACQARAADTPGYAPLTLNVATRKGVIITGRVLDGKGGKPVPGFVMASVLADNPCAKDYPEFDSAASFASRYTSADGSFRIVTLPGPVILMGGLDYRRLPEGEAAYYRYKPPVPDPKFPRYFSTKKGYEGTFASYGGGISPIQGSFCKVLVIKRGTKVLKQDVVLERAAALPVKVVDGDGRPVRDFWVAGISPQEWHRPVRIKKDSCEVYHLQSGKPRLVVFWQPGRKLFGTLRFKGDEKKPAVVRLGPAGEVRGRLIGENGKPLAGVTVSVYHRERPAEEVNEFVHRANLVQTDADGKFRIDQVLTAVKLTLGYARGRRTFEAVSKQKERSVRPGKVLDLGEIKMKLMPARGE